MVVGIWDFSTKCVRVGNAQEKGKTTVYSHYEIKIYYNDDQVQRSLCYQLITQVITVKLEELQPVEVREGASIEFSYSVQWFPTTELFEERFDKYLEDKFFEHQVCFFYLLA